ncbi:PEBP-like protein [Pholiota conissans]|uniref:PEBP-like protein n=1 Tax=Pholiota conissans TaxID=109636 RepID=A0A9P5YXB7_9AGAR|nr:PEBP-like protein [Pholiota conissans]
MSDPLNKVLAALKTNKIIPDVIPESANFSPSVLFSIVWPSNGTEVVLGDHILRDLTDDEPEIKILPMATPKDDHTAADSSHSGNISYTLVMTDPDAPSRADPKNGQWRHWVIPGVKLPAASAAETQSGFALKTHAAYTPYYPPAPPAGSGFHRYVFLLFQEPVGGVNVPSNAVERNGEPSSRKLWNAMAFGDKYNLKLVGANFFETQVEKK